MPNWAKVTIGVLSVVAVGLVTLGVRTWRAARSLRETVSALPPPDAPQT